MKLAPKKYKLKLMADEIQSELKAHAMEILKGQREFIENLIEIREAKGLSQADVGQLLGLSQSAVAQFEKRFQSHDGLDSALCNGLRGIHQYGCGASDCGVRITEKWR